MINQTVLMSDALHFSAEQAINPYYSDSHTDTNKAQAEHDAIQQAFIEAGVKVIQVPSPSTSQDGVYTANWALIRNNKAIIARLPDVRKTEEDWARTQLTNLGIEVINVPGGLKFSGQGDALACGNYLFCGSTYRSDEAAQTFAAKQLGYNKVQLQTIPQKNSSGEPVINAISGWADSFFYDIDLALSIIKAPTDTEKGLIAYCRDAFTSDSQATLDAITDIDKIEISLEEAQNAFACNLVSTGETVIMSAHAPIFTAELRNRGIKVITPEITELAKGGGYIRCTSLTIQ
ncbi:MAG: arginine deiminase-related protein [Candidatus Microsaccharimonas sp.]